MVLSAGGRNAFVTVCVCVHVCGQKEQVLMLSESTSARHRPPQEQRSHLGYQEIYKSFCPRRSQFGAWEQIRKVKTLAEISHSTSLWILGLILCGLLN